MSEQQPEHWPSQDPAGATPAPDPAIPPPLPANSAPGGYPDVVDSLPAEGQQYPAPIHYQQPPYGGAPHGQHPYGQPAPSYGTPGEPAYGVQQHGQQPYGQGYGQPAGAYGTGFAPPRPTTNGLAIASLVVALSCIAAPVGAILGHVARRQIRQRGESGDGLALAGIIIGWVLTALWLAGCAVMILVGTLTPTTSSDSGSNYDTSISMSVR